MAIGKKAQRLLEEKKQRLEAQIVAAKKVLDEMPNEIKDLLGNTVRPLLIEGKHEFDQAQIAALTSDEFKLLRGVGQLMYAMATDEYDLGFIQSMLSPKKGRPNKPIDPRLQAAIDERVRGGARKLTYKQLAIKHSGSQDQKEVNRFTDKLKKTMKNRSYTDPKKGK